jgi:hypothetical protein
MPDHVNALDWDTFPDWRYRTFTPTELVSLALDQPHPEQPWTYSTTNSVLAADGRRAQLVINSNTTTQESWQALHTALEVALCDAR